MTKNFISDDKIFWWTTRFQATTSKTLNIFNGTFNKAHSIEPHFLLVLFVDEIMISQVLSHGNSHKSKANRINHPYQMAMTVKKTLLRKIPTQKDVKLENPPKPKPGCQSEDKRRIQFNTKRQGREKGTRRWDGCRLFSVGCFLCDRCLSVLTCSDKLPTFQPN